MATRRMEFALARWIALAVDEHLPPAEFLRANGSELGFPWRERMERFCGLLDQGHSLVNAIDQSPNLFSDELRAAAKLGEQSGRFSELIQALTGKERLFEAEEVTQTPTCMPPYLVAGLIVVGSIAAGYVAGAIPAIQSIAGDLILVSGEIPLERLNRLSQWVPFAFPLVPGIALAWFLLRRGRWFDRSRRSGWFATLRGWTPGLRVRTVLGELQQVRTAGRPVVGCISSLARYCPDPVLRRRLLFVRNELDHGADPWSALQGTGLLAEGEAAALQASQRLGNTPWALDQVAWGKARRAAGRDWLTSRAKALFGLALAACFVGWIVVTVFQAIMAIPQGIPL